QVAAKADGAAPSPLPRAWSAQRDGVELAGDRVEDFPLDPVPLTGAATRSDGTPVAGFMIGADTNLVAFPTSLFSIGSTSSGPDGRFVLPLFRDTARFSLSPPAGSGFGRTLLEAVPITGAREMSIVLVDGSAPPPPETALSALRALEAAVSSLPRGAGAALGAI